MKVTCDKQSWLSVEILLHVDIYFDTDGGKSYNAQRNVTGTFNKFKCPRPKLWERGVSICSFKWVKPE